MDVETMQLKVAIEGLVKNPEREFEFTFQSGLPDVQREIGRIRYVPQGGRGFFQTTFYDEEGVLVGSRLFDEEDDVLHFICKNKCEKV
ncbi:hypothetical protein A374_05226 [Fictibacillus macauensis ZFHKF-1]|uniref:Uncharacterized protein n=1 Tax=Fictibacillus macauensis ZFHKF-1 TaxID=1196324 RepID=I8AL55_9BACL|nr:hypothetical protein [Fictibacillus macauensis]EIT86339.1 hypothetical protein A374_05226 [Fictibacillus macauensis ZFHKF-1]